MVCVYIYICVCVCVSWFNYLDGIDDGDGALGILSFSSSFASQAASLFSRVLIVFSLITTHSGFKPLMSPLCC